MEAVKKIQREYDPAHPNFERWQKAREISDERAKFVEAVLNNELVCEGLKILDIGAGEGSTSFLLSKKNLVTSLEPKLERILKIQKSEMIYPVMADSFAFPFTHSSFDIIILQDVIEHLQISQRFIDELKSILKDNGIIYLSTPNRYSIFNIIADPHWGIPLICLFNREQINKYFLKYFRKSDYNRNDIAELYSLVKIIKMFSKDFSLKIQTKFSVNFLLDGGKGIVWSKFHLQLIKFINYFGLSHIVRKIANDRIGLVNKFFTPTFYLIIKKKKPF
jgi:SAM-dependent methyltransferase